MRDVILHLPESEALALYRHLHRISEGQEAYLEAYRQLQFHFFQTLTVDEVTTLLEGES